MILEQVSGPEKPKALPPEDLGILAQEIRAFLVKRISHTGGHLASNLDVVELTITLFKTLNLLKNRTIWDVGHQSYTHKILSRCMAEFNGLRQYGGLSGFPKRKENPYDSSDTGHSSASISTGLGIALGRNIRGEDYRVVSVIGDGALAGGITYKVPNSATKMKKNSIIVLNDSKMSISENVRGTSRYLSGLRIGSGYNDLKKSVAGAPDRIPVVGTAMIDKIKHIENSIKQLSMLGILFENMGITYLGPADGHNIQALYKVLREAQKLSHAVLVHVITRKDRGYRPTEESPSHFHGVGPFDTKAGQSLSSQKNPSYMDAFPRKLCQLGQEHPELAAVMTAMPDGMGLAVLGEKFPNHLFGARIVEAHAATSVAGAAATGLRPVVAVYSSFLQRAYDQVLHDVYVQNLPVLFAVNRAGLVDSDGETHQGTLDYSLLTSIPNMSVMAPGNLWKLRVMLDSVIDCNSPPAVRYLRGEAYWGLKEFGRPMPYGVGEILYEEEDIAFLAVDSTVSTGRHVWQKLKAEGYRCSLADSRSVKLFDKRMVSRLAENHRLTVTMEGNMSQGGYGLAVTAFMHESYPGVKVPSIAAPDTHVEHGNVSILREKLGIDSDSIIRTMKADGYIGKKDRQIADNIGGIVP